MKDQLFVPIARLEIWPLSQVFLFLKFIYSEEAIKFCEISTVDKSKVEVSLNFEAFSEYMNFTATQLKLKQNYW